MATSVQAIAELKNNWLASQIDVEFPTQESLAGHSLYQKRAALFTYHELSQDEFAGSTLFPEQDVFLVDFHRLTVMFALLQAQVWEGEQEQALTTEFFTQIIYSSPCDLYLGFLSGEPVACAIVTQQESASLISDVVAQGNDAQLAQAFAYSVAQKCQLPQSGKTVYIEQADT